MGLNHVMHLAPLVARKSNTGSDRQGFSQLYISYIAAWSEAIVAAHLDFRVRTHTVLLTLSFLQKL